MPSSRAPRPPTSKQYEAALQTLQRHLERLGDVIVVSIDVVLLRRTHGGFVVAYRFRGDRTEQAFSIDARNGTLRDLSSAEARMS